jgi:hypothetical protein
VGDKSEQAASHLLWLDRLTTLIAPKDCHLTPSGTSRLLCRRSARWVGHLSGGDYSFPAARKALRAVLREVGRLIGSGCTYTCQTKNRGC